MELLPEECVAEILSRTSPRDACRSSAISRSFKLIADSDAVWDKFLPSDLDEILLRARSHLLCSTKKQRSLHLIHHPLVRGNFILAIDRSSGKKCHMVGARELANTLGNSPEWNWTSHHVSRFPDVALLQMVWWFELKCKIETRILSPDTVYAAFLVFKFRMGNCGFLSLPINVSFKYIDKTGYENRVTEKTTLVYLTLDPWKPIPKMYKLPKKSYGEWLEVKLAEFIVDPNKNKMVEIELYENNAAILKCGLMVEGIEFRPKVIA